MNTCANEQDARSLAIFQRVQPSINEVNYEMNGERLTINTIDAIDTIDTIEPIESIDTIEPIESIATIAPINTIDTINKIT
jgi:hypothetical protein